MAVLEPIGRLVGHADSVQCCSAMADGLVSGGDDGSLRLWDLRTTVGQVHRLRPPSTAGAVREPVAAVATSAAQPHAVYCSSGAVVHGYDMRQLGGEGTAAPLFSDSFGAAEEVSALAVNSKGTFLALADDGGGVRIIDLATRATRKALLPAHASLATTVTFRPRSPWEAVSGGLDAVVTRWDFNRGRALAEWRMDAPDITATGTEVFNPPWVHAVAVPPPGADAHGGAALVACARGDGAIAIINLETTETASRGGRGGAAGRPRALVLGRSLGGHTAAAGALAFEGIEGGASRFLLSGGNDCRVIAWSWPSVLAAAVDGTVTLTAPIAVAVTDRPVNAIAVAGTTIAVATTRKAIALFAMR